MYSGHILLSVTDAKKVLKNCGTHNLFLSSVFSSTCEEHLRQRNQKSTIKIVAVCTIKWKNALLLGQTEILLCREINLKKISDCKIIYDVDLSAGTQLVKRGRGRKWGKGGTL